MQEIRIKAVTGNLGEVTGFVDRILEENNCSMKTQMKIDVALEEIFVNIANYAYAPGVGEVIVKCGVENGAVCIIFVDGGKPFNPLERSDPDITLCAQERQIGGLGIYLVKKYMDSVYYEYTEKMNKLTVTKLLC